MLILVKVISALHFFMAFHGKGATPEKKQVKVKKGEGLVISTSISTFALGEQKRMNE